MRERKNNENKITIRKTLGHLKTICIHKYWVMHYCFMCGLYWQGITHDLSKFHPIEFWESVKYYSGTESPITKCKKVNDFSWAWFHHRGNNRHHWEMYLDDFEKGIVAKKMPFKYALESICDYLAAGRAYNGKNFSMQQEYEWWLSKKDVVIMHRTTHWFVDTMMKTMKDYGIENTLKNKKLIYNLKKKYNNSKIPNKKLINE